MANAKPVEDMFHELVSFIWNATGEYTMPMTRETLLEDDLGVTGDEAYGLPIAFSKKYNVDASNFNFTKYFYDDRGTLIFRTG